MMNKIMTLRPVKYEKVALKGGFRMFFGYNKSLMERCKNL